MVSSFVPQALAHALGTPRTNEGLAQDASKASRDKVIRQLAHHALLCRRALLLLLLLFVAVL